ncbi:MAG: hypothetical protein KDI71_04630 [Xanthomonadales bacterium]|nr:hypothetical protein [Xanthomonadales bacterium]
MPLLLGLVFLVFAQLSLAGTPSAEWTGFGWNGRGCNGPINAAVPLDDGSVLLGGYFTACGSVEANSLVKYDPVTNQFAAFSLAAEFRGPVRELIRDGDQLYVGGGSMAVPGAAEASVFAHLNLISGAWVVPSSLQQQTEDVRVEAMAIVSGKVYVAILFGSPGLLRFDPVTGDWADLGVPGGTIYALHTDGDELIVGGPFQTIGGISANYVAVLSPSQGHSWRQLGSGVDGTVLSITADSDAVYVSGGFLTINGASTHGVARFDRSSQIWGRVGQGSASAQTVRRLRLVGGELYATGEFTIIDGVHAINIARFDEALNRWQAIGSGVGDSATFISGLVDVGQYLYIGGSFRKVNGQSQHGITRLQLATRSWVPVGDGVTTGANGEIYEIVSAGDIGVIRGDFTEIGGQLAVQMAQIDCRTHQINPLGGIANHSFSAFTSAMAATPDHLYVGGGFFSVGGVNAPNLARFRFATGQWEALPGGSPGGSVRELHLDGSYLYAGGDFTSVGGISARRVARYNLVTDTWERLGSGAQEGANQTVLVITSSDQGVFVAGSFTEAGGITAPGLARFDPETNAWDTPDPTISGEVQSMLVIGQSLYVGGLAGLGPTFRFHLSRLDLTTGQWSAPGGQTSYHRDMHSLIYRNEALLVGGYFIEMADSTLWSIGSYEPDSGQWTAMGEGVSYGFGATPARVRAMALCGDKVLVGGRFNQGGTETSANIALLELPGALFRDSFDQ